MQAGKRIAGCDFDCSRCSIPVLLPVRKERRGALSVISSRTAPRQEGKRQTQTAPTICWRRAKKCKPLFRGVFLEVDTPRCSLLHWQHFCTAVHETERRRWRWRIHCKAMPVSWGLSFWRPYQLRNEATKKKLFWFNDYFICKTRTKEREKKKTRNGRGGEMSRKKHEKTRTKWNLAS